MKGFKEARKEKLRQHKRILDQLEQGSRFSLNSFCCACVWFDYDALKNGQAEHDRLNVESLANETGDAAYKIDSARLTMGPVLGQGGNGCVYIASYCGFPVAVKEMLGRLDFAGAGTPKSLNTPEEQSMGSETFAERERAKDKKRNEDFEKEFQNLKRIRHPHIIDLYGTTVLHELDTGCYRRLLVMELAACSLRDVLRNPSRMAPMSSSLMWAQEVASGLSFLHSRGLIHFDIKPANIVLDMSGHAKICDLGVARPTSVTSPSSLTFTNSARVGTPSYMAPELLRGGVARITNSIDVYSFGILLWEVLHRESPHPRKWTIPVLFKAVALKGFRPEVESDIPPSFATLIEACWQEDPDRRPTCEKIANCLKYLVPKTMPKLQSMDNNLDRGEPFYIWNEEARCFLSDCIFVSESGGTCHIDFEDGQPPQEDVDPRQIILAREIGKDLNPRVDSGSISLEIALE